MKKNEQNFDEIEELDEVEEFEEEEVVEDVPQEDIVISDNEKIIEDELLSSDEKKETSKKSRPVEKKSLSKGAKVGIGIGGAIAGLVVLVLLAVFVVLPLLDKKDSRSAKERYTGTLGTVRPTATAANEINSKMSAGEMLLAVVENYYAADYVASICVEGGVKTKVSTINVSQGVNSLKIREGQYADKNSNNAKYYVYSKSFGIANMYEEYYSTGNNAYYKKASKIKESKLSDEKKHYAAQSWGETTTYNTIDKFIEATATDFTKLWSYKVTKDTITSKSYKSKVTYDEEEGCYYFTVSLDLEKSVADYIAVMKYQLGSNMGFKVNELTFEELELEFCVWDNGFIKYFNVTESYKMNCEGVPVIKKLNMSITNNCMNEFSFVKTEKVPYDSYNATEKKVEVVDFDMSKFIANF